MTGKPEVYESFSGQGKSEGSLKHDNECLVRYNGGRFLGYMRIKQLVKDSVL
jgi:hypothetical protein